MKKMKNFFRMIYTFFVLSKIKLKPALSFYLLFMVTLLSGQSLEQEVITPFGDFLQGSGGMDLHCTMGEPIVERFENGEILTQGFHQVFDMATPVFEMPEVNIELNVFPNPAIDWLAIETDATETLNIKLYDTNGQIIYNSKMANKREVLNVSSLAAANYFLSISTSSELIQTFMIQKIK